MGNVITRGPYKGLRFPKRQIQAKRGNDRMRCGKCGGMDFEVHVKIIPPKEGLNLLTPNQAMQCRVADIVCLGCLKHREVDDRGVVQAAGRKDKPNLLDDYIAPTPTDIRAREVRKENES